ncbi:zinc transport system substrate-binding protein [Caminicella sporogenes DSM 14501]|uniref:Zinc transport system substrate-binding protein n=1 Tax=Caminicella sporogenes DSM 14501 TaxID=1121266 RepID=A0A1M6PCY6_9FIRM|nr:metal ABC transporter substrate-binding protein [Caminicella sporogenes]RKD21446.1 hypothetical protein BET04_08385 [Caminicella sporogenes]SHK05818.1 zinc transport system substrate-binding protein [Caminicella sporogenes DSM 14501]
MIKKFFSIIVAVLMLLTTACSTQSKTQSNIEKNTDKLIVYASIYPMYDFAKKIGKDKVDVKLMVPPGAEPHQWEPTAKLMSKLEKADVFIYNGVNMEMWADKLVNSLNNDKLIVVEASRGIELRKFERNDEHANAENKHHHGIYDPHIWLDPIRAIKQAENIKNAFIKADEKNKEFYEENFKEFADELRQLDEKYKKELKDRKLDYIVVSHAAFGYMADRYGLKQISISGLSPQEEPSAAKMAKISKLVDEYGIKYIFFETLASPKLAKVIAVETGAKTAVLNPIGGMTKEDMEKGKDYISVMYENLEVLKKAVH